MSVACRLLGSNDASRHDASRHVTIYAVCHASPIRTWWNAVWSDSHAPQQPYAGYAGHPLRADGVSAAADASHGHATAPRHGATALPWSANAW